MMLQPDTNVSLLEYKSAFPRKCPTWRRCRITHAYQQSSVTSSWNSDSTTCVVCWISNHQHIASVTDVSFRTLCYETKSILIFSHLKTSNWWSGMTFQTYILACIIYGKREMIVTKAKKLWKFLSRCKDFKQPLISPPPLHPVIRKLFQITGSEWRITWNCYPGYWLVWLSCWYMEVNNPVDTFMLTFIYKLNLVLIRSCYCCSKY